MVIKIQRLMDIYEVELSVNIEDAYELEVIRRCISPQKGEGIIAADETMPEVKWRVIRAYPAEYDDEAPE